MIEKRRKGGRICLFCTSCFLTFLTEMQKLLDQMALHEFCNTIAELVRVLIKTNVQVDGEWQPHNIRFWKCVLFQGENVKYPFSWPYNNLFPRNCHISLPLLLHFLWLTERVPLIIFITLTILWVNQFVKREIRSLLFCFNWKNIYILTEGKTVDY